MNLKLLILIFVLTIFSSSYISAEKRVDFDFDWKFIQNDIPDAAEVTTSDGKWRMVNLPHDWSIEGEYKESGNGTDWQSGYLPAGIGWYRKTFLFNPEWKNKKVEILFEGVYLNSSVWINGHLLGTRPNGYLSFYYDITPYLRQGKNVIAVKVDHSKPLSARWYTGSGIYRSVYLLVSDKTFILPWGISFVTPEVCAQKASFKVNIEYENNQPDPLTVRARIIDKEGNTVAVAQKNVARKSSKEVQIELESTISNPLLWSTNHPYVYSLVCTLLRKGKIIDETTRLVGFRKLSFSATDGFKINDETMKIKGVCDHSTAGAVGAAIPDDVLYRRLKLLKEMGCNTIRTAHNPYSPTFYTMCDTLGLMVMNEAFDGWEKSKSTDDYSHYFNEWWKRDLTDFVKRDRNHPSVIIWSIGNEVSEPTPATQKKLVDLIHTLDPTRPVTQGGTDPTRGMEVDYSKNFKYLDIVGFNGNGEEVGELEKFNEMHLNRCAIGTELPHTYQTRGVYRTQTTWRRRDFPAPWEIKSNIPWDKFKSKVFGIPDLSDQEVFTEESGNKYYQSSYDNASVRVSARHSWQRTCSFPFLMGEIRWGSFDYLGEAYWPQRCGNFGIIDICGFPKDHYYLYQSLWSDKPMVHLLPHWTHPGKDGVKIPVIVYTNCQSAELFLNGKSLGKQDYVGEQLVWQVPYQPGKLTAIAYNQDQIVARKSVETSGEPASLNVKEDKQNIRPNRKDIIHIEIDVADKEGRFCPMASNRIHVQITGAAKILAMDNGDPIDLSSYKTDTKKAFRGKCLLILQATDKKGAITVNVRSEGLSPKTIYLNSL